MFLKVKKQIIGIVDMVEKMVTSFAQAKPTETAISDCIDALQSIENVLSQEAKQAQRSLELVDLLKRAFMEVGNTINGTDQETFIENVDCLSQAVRLLHSEIYQEIQPKLNVVFFPYKAAMWNSLATVYEAAVKDDNCIAKVVPVPFYEIVNRTGTLCYEGDCFPQDVPITHYDQYDLAVEQPDIIFVHNIYDDHNEVTHLDEQYFSRNLKKYTDMLVYIPYCISGYRVWSKGEPCSAYPLSTSENIDKIVLMNDLLKESAIANGIPKDKIMVEGSPKIDLLVRNLKDDQTTYPLEWREKLEGKTVYLLNTGCTFFTEHPNFFYNVGRIKDLLRIPCYNKRNALIWRPHPLTRATIKKYGSPKLLHWYDDLVSNLRNEHCNNWYYKNVILDESADYLATFKVSDVLFTGENSFFYEFLVTGKRIVYLYSDFSSTNTCLDKRAFYFTPKNEEENLFTYSERFCEGYDPKKIYRQGLAEKVFTNVSGDCGRQVYEKIKQCVLNF